MVAARRLALALLLLAVAVAMAAKEEDRRHKGGTFEFNLPGHGNVKASWRVADEEESRWLDRMAEAQSSGKAADGGPRRSFPAGDDNSFRFSTAAYDYFADLLKPGTKRGEEPPPSSSSSHVKNGKPDGRYWEEVDDEGSRMLDRISRNARWAARSRGGDDHREHAGDVDLSVMTKQDDDEPSLAENDKEFIKSPPHDDM